MDYIKYDMTDIWASGGDIVAPDATKIGQGWGVEVVPRQWWNWMQNRVDNNVAYLLQKGIPEWDSTTEYPANKCFVVQGGIVYKSVLTSTNKPPVSSPAEWARAFPDYTAVSAALATITPTADGVPYFTGTNTATTFASNAYTRGLMSAATDAAGYRTAISAQTLHSNLTALSGVTPGANVLPYFTNNTTMAGTNLTSYGRSIVALADAAAARALFSLGNVATLNIGTTTGTVAAGDDSRITGAAQKSANLSDLTNTATARTNLGLGTGATATVTTSANDQTIGRLTKVGDFGLGGYALLTTPAQADSIDALRNGFYDVSPSDTWAARPVAGQWTRIIHNCHSNAAGYWTQIGVVFSRTAPRIFFRNMEVGITSDWVEMYTTQNSAELSSQVQSDVITSITPTLNAKQDIATVGVNSASITQDPNTSLETWFMTNHANGPAANGAPAEYYHIQQQFYLTKSDTNRSRSQIAVSYSTNPPQMWMRNGYTSSPGTVAPTWSQWIRCDMNGNAATATALQTARTINGVSFNGTANITVPITVAPGGTFDAGSYIDMRNTAVDYNVRLEAVTNPGHLTVRTAGDGYGSVYSNEVNLQGGWYRSTGAVGWYSTTYGGGIHMADTTWVRVYGGKSFYCTATVQAGNFVGNGAGLTGVTVANAGITGAIAASVAGEVGSYAFLRNDSAGNIGLGGTAAGASLQFSSHNSQLPTRPVGTWRCMSQGNSGSASVWLRIA